MSIRTNMLNVVVVTLFIVGSAATFAGEASDSIPTSEIYTYYQVNGATIDWSTCGYTPEKEGCFGSGVLGQFGRPCAVAGTSGIVYVADSNSSANGGNTMISVYRQIESTTPSVKLVGTVVLPIPGSSTAKCSMAFSGGYLWFGTDQVTTYYRIDRTNFAVTANATCGSPTTSISASAKFVVINQGMCDVIFDANGIAQQDGGESTTSFFLDRNAFIPES